MEFSEDHLIEPHFDNSMDDDEPISDEERGVFVELDIDKSGTLSLEELKAWESGHFYDQQAMKKLFTIADKDNDKHVTTDELDFAKEHIIASDANYILREWVERHEL